MSDPLKQLKLSAAVQKQLYEQVARGALVECSKCEALFSPDAGTTNVCSVCIGEAIQQVVAKPTPTKAASLKKTRCANDTECKRPSLKNSKYCAPYCANKVYKRRAKDKATKEAQALADKYLKAKRDKKANEDQDRTKVAHDESLRKAVDWHNQQKQLGDDTTMAERLGIVKKPIEGATATITEHQEKLIEKLGEVGVTSDSVEIVLMHGQYIGTDGAACHMPECEGIMRVKYNRVTKEPFYGCTKYHKANRKPGEVQCRASAQHLKGSQVLAKEALVDQSKVTADILVALQSSLSEFRALRTDLAKVQGHLKSLQVQMEKTNLNMREVVNTVSNIDDRTDETRKSLDRLAKEFGA